MLLTVAAGCEPGLIPKATPQVALPGGQFLMGTTETCADKVGAFCGGDHTVHPVKVSAFSLDKTEVTQLQYATCVVARGCPEGAAPPFLASHKDEPVVVDDPVAARSYCSWKMLRLPTEAEFEYAARGVGSDGVAHKYPWGDKEPDCDYTPFLGCDMTRAGNVGTTKDISTLGVNDLAGSVPEWVEDQYVPNVGCVNRLSYGDLCWGKGAACADDRCAADEAACSRGCQPPADELSSVDTGGTVTSTPVCLAPSPTAPPMNDFVARSSSTYAVVRGAGTGDRPCMLAGYTRRHATPRRFFAGFRCAKGDATQAPLTSYRFTPINCPRPDYKIQVKVTGADGKPIAYGFDIIPGATDAGSSSRQAVDGVIDDLECDGVFVVRPMTTVPINIALSDPAGCFTAQQHTANLTPGGDVPAVGVDNVNLVVIASCLITCSNSILDGGETDVDCGGTTCGGCATGKDCLVGRDCASRSCVQLQCAAATCTDIVQNGTETDVDCGGSCTMKCADGRGCGAAGDCTSGVCMQNRCVAASCTDKVKNDGETDVDCGGTSTCPKCGDNLTCGASTDCQSGICGTNLKCTPGTCSDVVKNGTETDVDCGGTCPMKCEDNLACLVNADCASGVCGTNLKCSTASCTDTVKNGSETDKDCGGGCPNKCADTLACAGNADCQSQVCAMMKCAAATCTDMVKNGSETDQDCGGTCPQCSCGEACAVDGDCDTNVCCTDGQTMAKTCQIFCGSGNTCGT